MVVIKSARVVVACSDASVTQSVKMIKARLIKIIELSIVENVLLYISPYIRIKMSHLWNIDLRRLFV